MTHAGWRSLVRDGRIHHVRGDRDHPVSRGKLCRKCTAAYNGALIDPDARLSDAAVRDGPKGAGRWREVSWEQAFALIARRLTDIVEGPGAQTILATHYTGTFAQLGYGFPSAVHQPPRRPRGRPRHDLQQGRARRARVPAMAAQSTALTRAPPRDAACILVWGANPSASAPHQHEHWLPEAPGR